MSVLGEDWVGRSLMAVRRLEFERPDASLDVSGRGALELWWDDRTVLLIDTKTDWTVTVVDHEWSDPYGPEPYSPSAQETVAELGRWVRRDVSRTKEFAWFIGRPLTSVRWHHNKMNEPSGVDLGVERRKLEVWRDGRRGAASTRHEASRVCSPCQVSSAPPGLLLGWRPVLDVSVGGRSGGVGG